MTTKRWFIVVFLFFKTNIYAQPTLKEAYRDFFVMGVAVSPRMMDEGAESALIRQQFGSLTAENAMKMGPIHPEENRYNWDPADKIADFASRHGLKLRGHTLCWHNQTPAWLFTKDGRDITKYELLARLRQHIFDVVGRYRGKIYAWDVVNEAVPDGGSDLYRKTKFYDIIGEEYIEMAFRYAHEADPTCLLFYNDYNTESPQKREKIYRLLKGLIEKGVPVHGVGLQGHWSLEEPTAQALATSIEQFASLGLKVQITELDVSVYPKQHQHSDKPFEGKAEYTAEMERQQTKQYQMIFEVLRRHKDKVTGVTFWNLSDKASWLDNFPVRGRKDFPLLFDQMYQPKKAYQAVVNF